jgi:hypothetical protein
LKNKPIVSVLFLVLVASLLAGVMAPAHAATPPSANPTIEIQRVILPGPYGVVHVADSFTLTNNVTTPISSLDLGYLKMYRNDFYYVDAKDNLGVSLKIDLDINSTSDFYWIRVNFAHEISPNSGYKFTVTSVFNNLINPVGTGFEFNFTAAPVLTQDARFANVTLLASQDSTFVTLTNSTYVSTRVNGFPALLNTYRPWKAYSKSFFYAPIRSVSQQLLNLLHAQRDIIIRADGSLSVNDRYALYNPSIALSNIILTLPDSAHNVMAYDPVGALWATPQNPNSPYQVTITPRYQTFRGSESFNFSLSYNLPTSGYLKQTSWWGSYNLTLSLFNDNEDLLITDCTVRIITPSGISLNNLKLPPQSPITPPFQVSDNYRTIKLSGITNQNNLTFSLTFNYLPFWSAIQILPWIFISEIAIFAAIIVSKYKRGPSISVPIPVERLREFVSLYDERLALSRELLAMEEDVNRGSMVKHEFRRRSKAMELRLDEINKLLMGVKSELRTISPHYDDLIRRIDRAEAEAEGSRASVNQVRGQYRSGKITRETYDTVTNDIAKRIDRAEETIETILITLREEAR